ncbi:rho guanine nucleotide exchange factor 19 [Seriola aureovittata]|uniref:rho guanine nucleotide exchange factor 19 n=1 Tax=Seriola aureovittata TaxID=2871759 RepID=UPI0024BDE497|nr:rho guanine nucleotide exchange factor 19 [Seriola aureovittata]XP_056240953.1 rho guanine nucleotide exchange factor 19 [Seriola aureovittata]XP_056240954.1 rho guanine nucleotide exchange factor 19 [Seriola aureovittata]
MLPGYGFSPFPDFQPHLHAFRSRGESPSMWIPGSGESQALSEAQDDRPLLHPCHHKHVAVCQQETLAFIELQPPVTPKLNGLGSPRPAVVPDAQYKTHSLPLNGFRHTLNELNDMQNGCHGAENEHETLTLNSHTAAADGERERRNGTEKPRTVTTVCRPLHAALSLPLSFPLSSLYTNTDSWESQLPSSPEGPELQSPGSRRPQRRTSQGSLKEKSIRRKMQVYSPDSPSDESLGSPILDADYIFPGPFASFLEEDLSGLSSLEAVSSPSSTDGTADDIFNLPAEPLQIIEDSILGAREDGGSVETSSAAGGSCLSRGRQGDQERRRFSASELISRLQLSQRKNSFTLKLGKSLSARVASRDRQSSNSLSPNPDYKNNSKHRSSGGSSDSAPHSPVGPAPPLPSSDSGMPLHRWSTKLSMRKKSIEEDFSTLPTVGTSNRLSRFLPSSILYQEYSDVAINREIQRQQGKEPGTEEEGLRDEGSDGTPSPSNLSPSSSFRSSRGSAFALWQDIPDVRTSGQLDNFSNEERKLQEAKFELVTSEASYIRSLTIAVDHFMLSQELADCLGAQDKQWLFSKLPEVKDVSERFLQDLEHRLEEDILRFDVCDIVLNHCPALRRVYLPYVTNQAYQEQTYQRLLHDNPRFPGILARLEEDPICQRLPLTSFLILPFQRITRLKMLVENILKRTTPGSRDEDTATKAFNELKKIIKECNSSVQSMKRMEELIHLNKKIHFEGKIFPLISQSRWLVKHGELLEVDTQTMSISGSKLKLPTKPVYLHLFNDCLLLSRRKDTWKFMVFVHAKIGELKVKDLSQKLQGISGFIFHLQLCEGQQLKHQILLKSHTESGKQRWITAMFPSDPLEDIEQASENDDISQVQCIKSYQAQEHDELTLEKADILHAKTMTSDGWVEGIRLSDGERGWFPKTYVEEITSRSARLRNLRENIRIKCVTQKLEGED